MLNLLASIEENKRTSRPRETFVGHIENYEQGFLDALEQNVNLVVVNRYCIQAAQQRLESFWRGLDWPGQCSGQGSFYLFMQKTAEAWHILFGSMLKRDDMKISREERSHTYVFHTGRASPYRWAEDAEVYGGSDAYGDDAINDDVHDETLVLE